MQLHFRSIILLIIVIAFDSSAKAQGLSISIGTGFGSTSSYIGTFQNDFTYFANRKIEYIKGAQIASGLRLDDHIEAGIEISQTWATLDFTGDGNINELKWTSFGGWGRYTVFPNKKLQIGILASSGIQMGYPKRMNLDTVEKGVVFYAGLHAGPQFKVSDHFTIAYYYGRGKYNNSILFTYAL